MVLGAFLRQIDYYIVLSFITIFSSGCCSYYYTPTNQNVLRFKQKGDRNIKYSLDETFGGCSLGYAFTDNIAVLTDLKATPRGYGEEDKRENYVWDNEVVLYKKLGTFYPAVNVGYGFGALYRTNDDFDLRFNRQFIQPSLGFSNDIFDLAVSARLARIKHRLEVDSDKQDDFDDVGKREFCFFEPAITAGIGYEVFKVQIQKSFASQIGPGHIKYIDSELNISIHLTF